MLQSVRSSKKGSRAPQNRNYREPVNQNDKIYNNSKTGGNGKFFNKEKIGSIQGFRTKDGKNFDEQVDLRRRRFIQNMKNNDGDQSNQSEDERVGGVHISGDTD